MARAKLTKRLLFSLGLFIAILISAIYINTLRYSPAIADVEPGTLCPSKVSKQASQSDVLLKETFKQVFNEVIAVPGLTIATTDG